MRATTPTILFCLASAASLAQARPSSRPPEQVKAPDPDERIAAADLSGRWSGTLEVPRADGSSRSLPMLLVLKQVDAALTGYGGPDLGDPDELSDGKIEGDTVRFDLGRPAWHAKLVVEADRLVGDLSDPGRPTLKVALKRVAYPTAEELRAPLAEIDALVAAAFARRPVGSLTVGVVSGSRLIWSKSYGNADMETPTPATQDTVYRIGSITKMFTALMLDQLVEQGKVHLSDPVEKYLPEVKTIPGRYPDAPPITLVQLATHTAGLSREPDDLPTYLKGPVSDWEKVMIAALPHIRYEFEPGTRHSYSNIGYAILGAALGRAAGTPYPEYVRARIFEPLGMTHSAFEPNPAMLPNLSKGYQVAGEKVDSETSGREHQGRGYKVPNGAIYTTAGDLARFASFLLGEGPESVLKPISLERGFWQQPVQANLELSSGYGRGIEVLRRDNKTAFGHQGGVAGYQATLLFKPRTPFAVILLANATGTPMDLNGLALRSLDVLSKGVAPTP